VDLLEQAQLRHDSDHVRHPLTAMFRDRQIVPRDETRAVDAETSVADALDRHGDFNRLLQTLKLTPIEQRLETGLGLPDGRIIRLPVLYFGLSSFVGILLGAVTGRSTPLRTTALSPSLVNLLVVGQHVIVPRPYGPRMRRADVESIVGAMPPRRLMGHWHWARRDTQIRRLAGLFDVDESEIMRAAQNRRARPICNAAGFTVDPWTRIWIPEPNVDLFEAYTVNALERIGLRVHFVDDWFYHEYQGEVHCGTNVKRRPAEAARGYAGPYSWGPQ
jgi:hypothetical protein